MDPMNPARYAFRTGAAASAALLLALWAGACCAATQPEDAGVQAALPLNHPARDEAQRKVRELAPLPDRGPDVNPWGITGPYYHGFTSTQASEEGLTDAQRAIIARHYGSTAQPIRTTSRSWVTGYNPSSGNN